MLKMAMERAGIAEPPITPIEAAFRGVLFNDDAGAGAASMA